MGDKKRKVSAYLESQIKRRILIAEEVRQGAMLEDVAEKYGLAYCSIRQICCALGVSIAGRSKGCRRRRKDGMSFEEFLEWAKCQCVIDSKTNCVLWPHAQNGQGYAEAAFGGKMRTLHRLVCEQKYGRKLEDGECACHTCDVRCCINPEHLFVGTKKDNADDRDAKGRNINHSGEKHGMAKLKEKDVRQIKDLIASGRMNLKEISKEYGAHHSTIWLIKHKKQWASVV